MKKHWYLINVGECPVCGRDQTYRERRYTKKPRKRSLRYVQIPMNLCYCGCMK